MGVVASLIQSELIDLACEETDQALFFAHQAAKLQDLGYVADSFGQALADREAEFPTGLALEHVTVAIPHTYVEHVKRPFIAFYRLVDPVMPFIQMGTDDVVVYPRYIMILGIKEAKAQVNLLAELMTLLSQEDLVAKLEAAQSPEAIVDLLSH